MTKTNVTYISASKDTIMNIPIVDGQLIFIRDFSGIAFDVLGVRKLYSNTEKIYSTQKSAIRIAGFYYFQDTNELWEYDGENWTQITESASNEKPVVYVSDPNVVLFDLDDGIYSIQGQYKFTDSDYEHIVSSKTLFVKKSDGIHEINGTNIIRHYLDNDELKSESYLTESKLDNYMTKSEAETLIAQKVSVALTTEVQEIIDDMFSLATDDQVQSLFN